MSINVEYVSLTDSLLVSSGNLNYLGIGDSNVTPAPQLAGLGSVNLGNNNGWDFSNIPGYGIAFFSVDGGNNENWVIVSTLVTGLDFLFIQDSAATPPYWWAGNYSVNGGNNTGWLFYADLNLTENSVLNDVETEQFFFTSAIVENLNTAEAQTTQTNFNAAIVEDSELLNVEFTANNIFNPDVIEAFQLNNVQTTANSVFNSAVVEPATLADIELGLAVFAGVVVEDAVYADAQAAQVNFNSAIVENATFLDFPITNNSVFNSAILENIIILDGQVPRGWFKINDIQNPNWTQINNSQ
jgi:uncharacterized protein YjbI with pentapeptide repeats